MIPNLLNQVRPRQVQVTVLDRQWSLTGSTAHDWIGAIGWDPSRLLGVMPGMVSGPQLQELFDLSWEHDDIEQRLLYAAQAAIGYASGRDWLWAYNLSLKSLNGWIYLNGMLVARGVRADQISFPDWLDAAFMLLWERGDEADRKALEFELLLPPKDMSAGTSPDSTRKMLEAFAAD